ncbi:MAG TPA: peptidylprolyl isomerase [Kofleriaceae bacterium]
MLRIVLASLLVASCSGSPGGQTMNNSMNTQKPEPAVQDSDVITQDIIAREPVANNTQIKHILIGWAETETKDPRAAKRTKKDAEDLVRQIMTQIKGGADFDGLMKQYSEDPGSAGSGRAYPVSPDAQLVIEFKQLGTRLKVGEVGVIASDYGFHIMKRVE